MNEARLKIVPAEAPSAFGHSVHGFAINPELDGAMVSITLRTAAGLIEIRSTHDWALEFATRLDRRVQEMKDHCARENIKPVQSRE